MTEIELKIGSLSTADATLLVSLVASPDRSEVRLFAIDRACRKAGVLLRLDADAWAEFVTLVARVQRAINP